MLLCNNQSLLRFRITNLRISLLSLAIQFLTSCSSMDSHFLNIRQVASFNPTLDSEYKYEFEDADEVIQELGKIDNKTRLIGRKKISLLYKILQKSNNGYVVSVNFLSCEIENISDASAATEHPENDSTYFHKSINSLKGTTFKLNLASDGQIENVSGYKEYLNKNSTANEMPYSENYFDEIFDRISQLVPSHKAFVGLSRNQKGLQNSAVEYLTDEYTLEKIGDNRVHIRSSSQVTQQISVMNTTLVMNGTEGGEIEIEANTGMPMNCSKVMKLQGACKIGGVDVVQTLVRTCSVLGEKIK